MKVLPGQQNKYSKATNEGFVSNCKLCCIIIQRFYD